MSLRAYVNEVVNISIKSATSGLTDVELVVTKPDGTDESTNLTASEVGSKAIYKAAFTPDTAGTYYLTIDSDTDTSIHGRILQVDVTPISRGDLGGTGYDSSADSLRVIRGKIDAVAAAQTSTQNGFIS